jgi:hypothetical protein
MPTVQHDFSSLCGKDIHNKARSLASLPDMIPYLLIKTTTVWLSMALQHFWAAHSDLFI